MHVTRPVSHLTLWTRGGGGVPIRPFLRLFAAALTRGLGARYFWVSFLGRTTVAPHCHRDSLGASPAAGRLPIVGHLNGLDKRAAAAAVSVPYGRRRLRLSVPPSHGLVRWPRRRPLMPRSFSALQSGAYDNAPTAAAAVQTVTSLIFGHGFFFFFLVG